MDVVLVDFMSLYFRNFHVHPDLSAEYEGVRYLTGGLYGCLTSISFLKRRYRCPIIVCIEPKTNFRVQLDPEYKATRKKKDPKMFKCLDDTLRAISLLENVFIISSEDHAEADDVIASFIWKNQAKFKNFYLSSADHDLLQIASVGDLQDRVYYIPTKGGDDILLKQKCIEKYGVMLDKILMFRAIQGDKSDNLPAAGFRLMYKVVREYVNKALTFDELPRILDENIENIYAKKIKDNFKRVQLNYEIMKLREVSLINKSDAGGRDKQYFSDKYNLRFFHELV